MPLQKKNLTYVFSNLFIMYFLIHFNMYFFRYLRLDIISLLMFFFSVLYALILFIFSFWHNICWIRYCYMNTFLKISSAYNWALWKVVFFISMYILMVWRVFTYAIIKYYFVAIVFCFLWFSTFIYWSSFIYMAVFFSW